MARIEEGDVQTFGKRRTIRQREPPGETRNPMMNIHVTCADDAGTRIPRLDSCYMGKQFFCTGRMDGWIGISCGLAPDRREQ